MSSNFVGVYTTAEANNGNEAPTTKLNAMIFFILFCPLLGDPPKGDNKLTLNQLPRQHPRRPRLVQYQANGLSGTTIQHRQLDVG